MGPALSRFIALLTVVAIASAGCARHIPYERLSQARHLSADLSLQFSKGVDAANRAVMADTDEAATGSAKEARRATEAIQTDLDVLRALLNELGFADEARLLEEFRGRFAEYHELDRQVLELAVENTNTKADRLSYGPALETADAFRDAVERAVATGARDPGRARALAANAVASVREIQALQAPHIAESTDAVMARLETRMASAEQAARDALAGLKPLVSSGSAPALAAAEDALARFMTLHAEILVLSRRNTDVRSLALSLTQKGQLIAACEDRLRALRDALGKRRFNATR